MRSYIATCTFLKKFTLILSNLEPPLYAAAFSKVLNWTSKCNQLFEALKTLFLFAPTLCYADGTKPFIQFCDSSKFSIAGALLQTESERIEQLVVHFSRKLQAEELNTIIYNKEVMAVLELILH